MGWIREVIDLRRGGAEVGKAVSVVGQRGKGADCSGTMDATMRRLVSARSLPSILRIES